MTDRTPKPKEPAKSAPKPQRAQYAVLGAICALVIGVYAWSAKSGKAEPGSLDAENTYYNLLVEGFRAGQLDLKREVPFGLAKLPDSYDPAANDLYWLMNCQLLDLSYYRSKLYLYFGVTPALVLFWPYAALTGHHLLHQDVVAIFFSAGFLVSAGLLWAVWRRYFSEVGFEVVAAGVLALGLANFTVAILQRSGVYEVAISCGCALSMVTLTLIWQAMHATRRRAWWLTGASLAYGLGLGARPSLLFGAIILLVPMAMIWQKNAAMPQQPPLRTLLLAATGPITVIGFGLLLYNFLRFDNPLEFGQRYQLPAGPHQQFSLDFLWSNVRVCFLEPACWSGRFPFVHGIDVPPLPEGSGGVFEAFGVLTNVPVVWLALAAPLAWRSRLAEGRSVVRWFLAAATVLFGIGALMILLHDSICLRYEVEFASTLVLLAVIGIFGLERALASRSGWRLAVRWGWGVLLAFSVSFNLFAMFEQSSEFYVCRGAFSLQKGKLDEAIGHFQKALQIQPDNPKAHTSLGAALFKQGKVPEGMKHLEEALRLKPEDAEAHNNLGASLTDLGRVAEAIGHLEQAVRLNPDHAEARYNLGVILFRQGKVSEAIGHLAQAVRLKPARAEARNILGACLTDVGRVPEAIEHLEQAVGLKPDYVEAHFNLGTVLFRQGKVSEAVEQYRKALELNPQLAWGLNSLAWILATETNGAIRKVEEAVRCAEQACGLTTNQVAIYLDTLGVAYSEAGRFSEAVQTTERGVALARATGNQELAAVMESRLDYYRSGRAYHSIPRKTGP